MISQNKFAIVTKAYMNKLYTLLFVFTVASFVLQVFAQSTAIKRASLSTSVADAHSIQHGQYKVQQSIGHMGIMSTVNHNQHTATRGFLLPQMGASTAKPIADFDWVVYPNPFDRYVNIDFNGPVSGDMVIRLHDVTGQLILEKEVAAKQQQRIHLGHLAQASYVLHVQVMGKTFSQTLLNHKNTNRED